MWLLKGASVGLVAFGLLTALYVVLMITLSTARAVGTTTIYGWTFRNPIYWAVFVIVLVLSCVKFRLSH